MNASNFFYTVQDPEWLEGLKLVIDDFLIPIGVAIATYIMVDRLGEWRKRRTYSRLGVAIIESLQEEIKNGIELMTNALNATKDQSANAPPPALLPNRSWSGMSTIPDDVLLRIIETSANRQFDGFPPRECRIHCKNYFEHMCQNYLSSVASTDPVSVGKLIRWQLSLLALRKCGRGVTKFRRASGDSVSFLGEGGAILGPVAGAGDDDDMGAMREAIEPS